MPIEINSTDVVPAPQAAKEVGVPKNTFYRWINEEKLISINLFGMLLIPRSEIIRIKEEKPKIAGAVTMDS